MVRIVQNYSCIVCVCYVLCRNWHIAAVVVVAAVALMLYYYTIVLIHVVGTEIYTSASVCLSSSSSLPRPSFHWTDRCNSVIARRYRWHINHPISNAQHYDPPWNGMVRIYIHHSFGNRMTTTIHVAASHLVSIALSEYHY